MVNEFYEELIQVKPEGNGNYIIHERGEQDDRKCGVNSVGGFMWEEHFEKKVVDLDKYSL